MTKLIIGAIISLLACSISFPRFLSKIHTLFKDYLKYRKLVEKEENEKKLEEEKKKLKEAADSGNLGDLIDAAKKYGEVNKKL